MANLKRNESGLIPLLICVLLVIGAIIYFAYIRVAQAQH
jgi:sorbitol-specific phosphotransferase system component IIC